MDRLIENDSKIFFDYKITYLLLNCIQIGILSDKGTEKQYVSAQY